MAAKKKGQPEKTASPRPHRKGSTPKTTPAVTAQEKVVVETTEGQSLPADTGSKKPITPKPAGAKSTRTKSGDRKNTETAKPPLSTTVTEKRSKRGKTPPAPEEITRMQESPVRDAVAVRVELNEEERDIVIESLIFRKNHIPSYLQAFQHKLEVIKNLLKKLGE